MHRSMLVFAAVVATCFNSLFAAINGFALVIDSNGDIKAVNVATGTSSTIVLKSDFDNYHNLSGPCFSPDGKRVAYFRYQLNTGAQDGSHILIVDNDHTDITYVCKAYKSTGSSFECSWANNGFIYWSEDDDKIYRVNVTTKTKEQVTTLGQMSGSKPSRIDNLKVSLDGNRGGCMVNGSSEGSFGFDFPSLTSKSFGSGCQGTVSPSGLLITRNTAGALNYSYHQVAFIHNFASGAVTDTMIAPGAVPGGGSALPRFVFHRFSHSSNDHVVASGEDALNGRGYVFQLSTNESRLIGTCTPYDFWNGPLPAAPTDGPVIALDSSSLQFISQDGAVPASKTVRVSNTGIGTLTNVSFQANPSWLTITRSGAGNTQTLANAVNPSGLAPGVYNATITVSGGGASNSVNYAVTLNVARSLLAPTALTVSANGPSGATLRWTDNTSTESGFEIQRKVGTGLWQRRVTTATNIVTCSDTGLIALTMYHYRVRAFVGADSSAWSNLDSLELATVKTITVTSPSVGQRWRIGDTVHIRWSAQNVGQVDISYSLDGGENALLVYDNAVATSDPLWGDFRWVVPALTGDSIMIRIGEYGNPSFSSWSANIALEPRSLIRTAITTERSGFGLREVQRVGGGAVSVRCNPGQFTATLDVMSIDGSLLYRTSVGGQNGDVSVLVHGITAAQMLLVRLHAPGRATTIYVPALR